ncbi:hypothetical protein DESPIG_02825 [Desulfovibrio piger ATCC 29098]|uniref:Uncharacterized protein n=1 Tax=Desulfovibrio piger ATCC 29098 TaxID=411464 RepID=B6WXJ8_9BACT|nr:hypothetical protein DESPIG_02825 [Desulfovibrio piger ATCC 29098]
MMPGMRQGPCRDEGGIPAARKGPSREACRLPCLAVRALLYCVA